MSKAREQVAKEQRIVRLLRSGATPQRVAEMFDLTDRRVRQIAAAWRDVPSIPPAGVQVDSGAEVLRLIERLEMVREDLVMLAESTSHDGVRLGALRDRRETEVLLMQVRVEAGLLPRDLSASNGVQEFVGMARGFVELMRRRGVDEDVVSELLSFVEQPRAIGAEAVAA
jgi:hypothetical protein